MTVLSIILGVLMIACGAACMFTPLTTFMDAGYFIVILVAVYGIIGIVKAISEKNYGLGFVFSLLSLIFGVCVLCFPGLMILTEGILIYLVAAWFIIQGFVSIYMAIRFGRVAGGGIWVFQLIIGILGIILGFYTLFHPMVAAVSLGILIGFYFIETGFVMIFAAAGRRN